MRNRFLLMIVAVAVIGMTAAVFLGHYLLFTENGGALVFKRVVETAADVDQPVTWRETTGSLAAGMTYTGISLENLKGLPFPNRLKIQKLKIDIHSLSLQGVDLSLDNARLTLPDADPILLFGTLQNAETDFNLYTQSLSFGALKTFFGAEMFGAIEGNLSDIDVYAKGPVDEPVLSGKAVIDELSLNGFSLVQVPCAFEGVLKNVSPFEVQGSLVFSSGTIKGQKTAMIRIEDGRLGFHGNPLNPDLHVTASAVVEKVKISVSLQGNPAEPDLQINSTPPLSRDQLLLALATNRIWPNTEDMLNDGGIPSELAKDFLGYLIFGGQGNKFAEKFGLKSLSVKVDKQTKGVAVSKDLSERLEGDYEIESRQDDHGKTDVKQKVGGAYRLTDTISIEAEKELKPREKEEEEQEKPEAPADDRLLMKFKKSF